MRGGQSQGLRLSDKIIARRFDGRAGVDGVERIEAENSGQSRAVAAKGIRRQTAADRTVAGDVEVAVCLLRGRVLDIVCAASGKCRSQRPAHGEIAADYAVTADVEVAAGLLCGRVLDIVGTSRRRRARIREARVIRLHKLAGVRAAELLRVNGLKGVWRRGDLLARRERRVSRIRRLLDRDLYEAVLACADCVRERAQIEIQLHGENSVGDSDARARNRRDERRAAGRHIVDCEL